MFRLVNAPSYTAPERWTDHIGWQLKKADVWAVAVIAFEMFVGDRCFDGENEEEIFQNLTKGQWAWPEDRKPSDSMQDFIGKCLALDPRNRLSADDALAHRWIAGTLQDTGLNCKSPTHIESLNGNESIKCVNENLVH